jgi:hypothetical protein
MIDHGAELVGAVANALADPDADREIRDHAVAAAYHACDGRAAERAAAAIMELIA